jgi:apolipoprotein N-acyltransferase
MESVHKVRQILIAAAAVIATALLVWFGAGLTPWWPLTWFAPLPLFWYALRSRWWSSAIVSMLGFLLGSTNLLGYFLFQGMPFGFWLANYAALSLMVTAGVLLFRLLVLRGAVWIAMLALPALWVAVDWLRFWYTPHGTSADLAYTQLEFLPFLQLAALTGPWGMSFLLLLVPGALAVIHHLRSEHPRQALKVGATLVAILAAVLGYGEARLMERAPRQTLRVGLLVSDSSENVGVADRGPAARRLFDAYAVRAKQLALAGAQVIVMPEKIAAVSDDARTDDSTLQPAADATGAVLVAGEVRVATDNDGSQRYNRAVLYAPRSSAVSYDKQHLLPPFESNMTPGRTPLTAVHAGAKLGVAICKDMDFTTTSLAYGARDAQVMLVPAWDFHLDRSWHGHMAIMRGVEGGFGVVRAAKNGFLTVSDDRGRILGEVRSDSAPFASLLVDVPVAHDWTLFQAWGNWFAWLCVGLLTIVVVRAMTVARAKPAVSALPDMARA